MKLSTLFVINAVIAFVFGIGFVLIPNTLVSFYGVELNTAGTHLARLLGGAFIGYGLISWLLKDSSGPDQRSVVLALTVSELLGFVIALMDQLQGNSNALGWSTVVIYLVMGLAFGYFYFKKS